MLSPESVAVQLPAGKRRAQFSIAALRHPPLVCITLEHQCRPVPAVAEINGATKSLLRKEIGTEAFSHPKSLPLEGGVQQWVGCAVVARARPCAHMNLRIRATCAPEFEK